MAGIGGQGDLFQHAGHGGQDDVREDDARALIDQLISDTNLYATRDAQLELFEFVSRFTEYAPFNAMLMHVQKPGVTYVANTTDWARRFRRRPKQDARPLVILQPFGPVNFVFDVQDTEGEPMPEGVLNFEATGNMPKSWWNHVGERLEKADIDLVQVDQGDSRAGYIQLKENRFAVKQRNVYRLAVN